MKKKYKIIDRNAKVSYREIDIISKYCDMTIFVEVKTRTSNLFGGAADALGSKKIKLLKRAITEYSINNYINLANIRLDFIAIDINNQTKKVKINHYKDIF